jgi:RHS repeat-associated protein
MTLGSGLVRVFSTKCNSSYNFHLREERYPSGNSLSFNYGDKNTQFKKITAKNALGDILGYVEFDQKDPKKPTNHYTRFAKKDPPVIRVHSSQGKTVKYGFKTLGDEDYLSYVDRPNAPLEHYSYQKSLRCEKGGIEKIISHQLISKNRPNGRFQKIEYYNKKGEDYKVAKSTVTLTGSSPFLGRVKCLKSPVGPDNKPIVTHSFIYHGEEYKVGGPIHIEKKIGTGYTDVYDAYNRPTRYSYGWSHRLTSIEKIGMPKKTNSLFPVTKASVYSKDAFYWNSTNLKYRVFTGQGKVCFWRHYLYDKNGNITEERLFGNLTGAFKGKVKYIPDYTQMEDNCEVFIKKYKYQEAYNLPIEENDGRKIISLKYYPNSELLQQRLIKDGDKICQRQFFEYDINAVLVKEITDDGSSEDINNLSDVTERHIKLIQPSKNIPIGFPEVIEEKYLNLLTGNEELLSKVVNAYSSDGYVLRQDHYDSNDQFIHASYWEYDEKGNVTLETNPLGETTSRDYDKNGNLIYEKKSGTDFHKEMTYDYANRLIRAEDVHSDNLRLAVCYKYNLMSQKVSSKDTYGNETKYVYDYYGRLSEIHHPAVPNEQGTLIQAIEKTEYNALNHPVSQTDPLGNVTKTAYTIRGKPYRIDYPDGSRETCKYTLDGLLKRSVAKNGVITHFQHDYLGRVISTEVTSPTGELLYETSSTYNTFHLLSEIDASGAVTKYTYDHAGRLTQISKEDRLIVSHYDSLGRNSKTLEYYGYDEQDYIVKAQEYDLLNRVVQERTEDALGNILKKAEYSYDTAGNRCETKTFNQAGVGITTTTYSPYHEPELITDPYGNVTRTITDYTYWNEFQQAVARKDIVDALGNTTVVISDVRGRVATTYRTNTMGEMTQKKQFFYDANGNRLRTLETVITPNDSNREVISTCEYDASNRLIHSSEAWGTPEQKQTRICYNEYGQKEMVVKPDGVILFHEYDFLGRLATFKASDDSFHYIYSYDQNNNPVLVSDERTNIITSKVYDKNNRMICEVLGNGLATEYSYDRMGRPLHVTYPDQSGMSYVYQACFLKEVQRRSKDDDVHYAHVYNEYDLAGSVTAETLIENGGKTNYQYDLLGRTLKISNKQWQETVPSAGFDSVGNLLQFSITDALGTMTSNFAYDDLYQLKSEQGAATHKYSHDSLLNRVEKDDIPHSVNALNQLLSDSTSAYKYDLNGNLLHKSSGDIVYAYDALNRLISVTQGQRQTCYTYDAFNRRLSKVAKEKSFNTSNWEQKDSTLYFYHGQNEIGACNDDGVITELRLLGSGKGAEIGAAVAIELQGKLFAPMHDHNGNVVCLINAHSGISEETYRYSAFGEEFIFDGSERKETALNPWRFSSKRVDPESKLVYFGRRYYDPETARWLTPDPLGECAGPNLYAYVNNNPLTHFDAYGLWVESPVARPETTTYFRSPRQDYESSSGSESTLGSSSINSIVNLPGNIVEAVGHHFVPVPFIGDAIEILGRVLARKSLRDYQPTFRRPWSTHYYIAGLETLERRLLLENGICTSLQSIGNKAIETSKSLGGARVDFVHNASRGFVCDILTTACQKLMIPTPSARVSQDAIQYCLDHVGPTGIVYIGAHSQGGQIINYNLHRLDDKPRDQLNVSTYGAPCIIAEGMANEVHPYISSRDGIPLFSNVDYLRAKMDSHTHVVFIKSNGYPFVDHFWDEAYDKPFSNMIDEYRKSCMEVSK